MGQKSSILRNKPELIETQIAQSIAIGYGYNINEISILRYFNTADTRNDITNKLRLGSQRSSQESNHTTIERIETGVESRILIK